MVQSLSCFSLTSVQPQPGQVEGTDDQQRQSAPHCQLSRDANISRWRSPD